MIGYAIGKKLENPRHLVSQHNLPPMKAVLQRVRSASVEVDQKIVGQIGLGLLILLGAAKGDTDTDVNYMVRKIPLLRIFPDESGKMNRSVVDIRGAILMVSQFTLLGDVTQGRRPSFEEAAPPDIARGLYDLTIAKLKASGLPVQTGRFGASMLVSLQNDGPVTFLLDSRNREKTKMG